MSDYNEPPTSDEGRRTGWAELGTGETVELARPGTRFGARILDVIIVGIFFFILAAVAFGGLAPSGDDSGVYSGGVAVMSLVGLAILLAYEVVQIAVWGQTPGKRMTGIKVINAAHGGVPGWGKAVGRWLIPGLVLLIPIVGWLLAILCYVSLTWDRVYQGWHDKAAGTLVVRV
ncbi:RDD family protein [Candidatus Poriferisodalis sp.]|uniref:RDD family protein n=1 Tax=Candidatus Poriferisodalis sp. TaxID=3101277 RepID=UPI003AF89D6E